MLIAKEKKRTNIAEYVIYMFQIQDMIRACGFNRETIIRQVVTPQTPKDKMRESIQWFDDIIEEMERRNLEKSGNITAINEVLNELVYLHTTLVDVVKNKSYLRLYENAQKVIEDFQKRSDLKEKHPIEVAFHALYMKLLLKLKNETISDASEEGFQKMTKVLSFIGKGYHEMKNGNMTMFEVKDN